MIRCWNIKGLNGFPKQKAMRSLIFDFSLGLVGLLETKVNLLPLHSMVSKVCSSWKYQSNVSNSVAYRVLVCWDPTIYNVVAFMHLFKRLLVSLQGYLMGHHTISFLSMVLLIRVIDNS